MCSETIKKEGLRGRKRRETLLRIAETGLNLFAEQGYDATTLEAIAEASGISPRTFFYYFKTKDEVLQYWQGSGFAEAIAPTLSAQPTEKSPLHAVRDTIITLVTRYQNEKSLIVDRIYNSSEMLHIRKQGLPANGTDGLRDTLPALAATRAPRATAHDRHARHRRFPPRHGSPPQRHPNPPHRRISKRKLRHPGKQTLVPGHLSQAENLQLP